jgi:hypothetical protein
LLKSKNNYFFLVNRTYIYVEAESGAAVQIYGSAEPEQKELFTAPEQ